jgi:CHAD domain-containing protein
MKLKPAHTAAENARVVLPKMARRYFEAGRKAIEGNRPPDELHKFRIETKRFRYTLELFRPLYGPNLDRYLKALRGLQSALGKVSDYQSIQRVLADDREVKKHIDHALKGKLKDLRRSWRAFDSHGQLKRWRTYLAGDHSKPRSKPGAKVTTRKPPGVAAKSAIAQAAG